ncbi:zinc-dependent metalloprotease [Arcanobacterium buesumense]|uniref:Hydrolase n=1 Tax=Arcanobacterium buesumense TaxID=2722751 RepID=A0A6H2EJX5_9ACTO|nr:zinc-dependent metalloprotease [Arcanobacterium buesumense]QJC21273.1 hypothetical protein HC352_01215 [Arcanobacterium buesumense]
MSRSITVLSRLFTGGGPDWKREQAQQFVAQLSAGSELAPKIVEETSGLQVPDIPVRVVDRGCWAKVAVTSIEAMLGIKRDDSSSRNSQIAFAASVLSMKVLGQWDPYSSRKCVYLVAPNIADFQQQCGLDKADLSVWVAVHELTHVAQFSAAHWLADYIAHRAQVLFAGDEDADDEQVLDEITAVMSLLEGHATYVMNQVPLSAIPSRAQMIAAMVNRRASSGIIMRWMSNLTGLAKKKQQYVQGHEFVSAVIDSVGLEKFNMIWQDPRFVPTIDELAHPHQWIGRVVG